MKSQTALKCRSVYMAIYIEISLRQRNLQGGPQKVHLNTSDITSHGTNSFQVKLITPGHPIPKISTRLTIFRGGTWKTKFVKTIHSQERTSSEKKSDGLHKKCSIDLWTILLFQLLLCCHTAARCMKHSIDYWKI